MDQQSSIIGYLIPLSLIAGFILFPLLLWLGKSKSSKKSSSNAQH